MVSCRETAYVIEMPFWICTRVGPKKHVRWGLASPHGNGQFWGVVLSHWKCIVTARAPKWRFISCTEYI